MEKYRQNIFGIGEIYELQREGQWVEKTRENYREYGYFGGGVTSARISTVDRIDYSNDTATASVRGPLSTACSQQGATGNSNFGYFGGGYVGPILSKVDRIDYSNDSTTASARGPLSLARFYLSATGNSNFGYFASGRTTLLVPYPTISIVDRINYTNDLTIPIVRGPLSLTRAYICAGGNSNFGYFAGGRTTPGPTYYSTIDRTNYSNDTLITSVRGPLTREKDSLGFTGNSSYGWLFGGTQPYYSRIERIDYSNDLVLPSIRTVLSSAKSYGSANGNSNFGFYGGGYTPSPLGPKSTVERIDYVNDTSALSIRGPLSLAKYTNVATSSASFGGSPVSYLGAPWVATAPFGYFGGGGFPTGLSTVDRIDYSNDTNTASVRGPLSAGRDAVGGTGNNSFGYFSGGGSALISIVDRIDYSNDIKSASTRGPLSSARKQVSATGNSNFGYFGGGYTPGSPGPIAYSTIDRIDYTNDSVTASVRGSLQSSKWAMGATGNSNFGYFVNGFNGPSNFSNIERLDYSNDSANTAIRGYASSSIRNVGSTGNSNFGYFGGGFPSNLSIINRIDYSNDTTTPLLRGLLSSARRQITGTGNSNFGYFGGGIESSDVSTVDRINYSNDTQTASIRGPLSSARSSPGASSSQAYGGAPNTPIDPLPNYIRRATVFNDSNTLELPFKRALGSFGYFGGSVGVSIVARLDYSNDLSSLSIRGPITAARGYLAGGGNNNFGYFGGGSNPGVPATYSTIDRIDYSNDLSNALVRSNLPIALSRISAVSNNNFGYFGSSTDSSNTIRSFIYRIDYTADNFTPSLRGPFSNLKYFTGATGNSNFGYFGGGNNPGLGISVTLVDRIDYSNDTAKTAIRNPLNVSQYGLAATGNQNFGYFGGGFPAASIPLSNIERINYSNDTTSPSLRGNLTNVRTYISATGNSNFGYFGGGVFNVGTRIDRIDYSNDLVNTSSRSINSVYYASAATTNARFS